MKHVVILSFNQYIGSALFSKLNTPDFNVEYLYLTPNNAFFDLPEDLDTVVVVPRSDSFSSWLEISEYEKMFIGDLISDVNRTNENAKVIYLSNSLNSSDVDDFCKESILRIEEKLKESLKNICIIRVGEIIGEKQIPTSYNSFASICLSIINDTKDDNILSKTRTFTYLGDALSCVLDILNTDKNSSKTLDIGKEIEYKNIVNLLSHFNDCFKNKIDPKTKDEFEEKMLKVFIWYRNN